VAGIDPAYGGEYRPGPAESGAARAYPFTQPLLVSVRALPPGLSDSPEAFDDRGNLLVAEHDARSGEILEALAAQIRLDAGAAGAVALAA